MVLRSLSLLRFFIFRRFIWIVAWCWFFSMFFFEMDQILQNNFIYFKFTSLYKRSSTLEFGSKLTFLMLLQSSNSCFVLLSFYTSLLLLKGTTFELLILYVFPSSLCLLKSDMIKILLSMLMYAFHTIYLHSNFSKTEFSLKSLVRGFVHVGPSTSLPYI